MAGVGVIWLTTALMCVLAPDMVTGSQHEHLPLATITVWVWAVIATAYVLMSTRTDLPARRLVLGVSGLWLAILVVVVAAPVMTTGTDPTTIPIAVLVAPVLGTFATGFLALSHTLQGVDRPRRGGA